MTGFEIAPFDGLSALPSSIRGSRRARPAGSLATVSAPADGSTPHPEMSVGTLELPHRRTDRRTFEKIRRYCPARTPIRHQWELNDLILVPRAAKQSPFRKALVANDVKHASHNFFARGVSSHEANNQLRPRDDAEPDPGLPNNSLEPTHPSPLVRGMDHHHLGPTNRLIRRSRTNRLEPGPGGDPH